MPPSSKHLTPLHSIVRRGAEAQMLFAFVHGVLSVDNSITVRSAVLRFKKAFCLDDLDVKACITRFHRMRNEALRDSNILQ
jgi:hypothetical protein